jgi:acyl-CoA:acyl-CoA alkyltransferase
MHYSKTHIEALGYELAPIVVTSDELEERIAPVYEKLRIPEGQLEAMTGIAERRWWPEAFRLSDGAISAARKALAASNVVAADLGAVLYCGVCRELFEPATACRVAGELGVRGAVETYDISNACLGVLNGMIDVANRIELGQIRAGLVVSCETARDIVEEAITCLLADPRMEQFSECLATLTGGSGAVAVLLSDGSFGNDATHQMQHATVHALPEHHMLCRWGLKEESTPGAYRQFAATDAVSVLKYGVDLGKRTWDAFLAETGWNRDGVDKVICHQVGATNRDTILRTIGIPHERDFSTFEFLGNMGTVALPLTAALAHERGFLQPGDQTAFLGIGSGLNCMMLALEW